MKFETAFSIDTSSIKYGPGVSSEAGYELNRFGVKRAMVLTDSNVSETQILKNVIDSIKDYKIDSFLYTEVRVEPTDKSFKNAIKCAQEGKFDGIVAIGGGSTLDTAKACNLYSTYKANF